MYNKFNDLPQNLKDKFQGYNITAKYESRRKVYTERSKKSYVEFINLLEKNGHELVSCYYGNQKLVTIDFKCGHQPHSLRPHDYKLGGGCRECFKIKQSERVKKEMQDEKRIQTLSNYTKKQWQNNNYRDLMSYNKSSSWKGGVTELNEALRDWVDGYKKLYKKKVGYKCEVTGKKVKNLHLHHLFSFDLIIRDAHEKFNIERRETIGEYNSEELLLLKKYVIEFHENNNIVILIDKKIHEQFHEIYGNGNNTPEQFKEFIENFYVKLENK